MQLVPSKKIIRGGLGASRHVYKDRFLFTTLESRRIKFLSMDNLFVDIVKGKRGYVLMKELEVSTPERDKLVQKWHRCATFGTRKTRPCNILGMNAIPSKSFFVHISPMQEQHHAL